MAHTENPKGGPKGDVFDELLREALRDTRVSASWIQSILNLPSPGDVIDGKFEIKERLGTGGMGAVFSAVHMVTQKRVALKWMLPSRSMKKDSESRFIREAQAAGRIDHPNVVDVYDIGRHENAYYLVMELLHGEPLSAHKYRGAYTPKDAIALIMPVMRGVAAAHAEGVIHRDLKPANVFVCRGPDGSQREPKVLDFGISKLSASESSTDAQLTTTSTVLGTPHYMAPEQLRAGATVDHRADIYALGVILYELLSGQLPYGPMSTSQLIVEIATGTPEPLSKHRPDLPGELIAAVMNAMARDPDARYPDVRAFALALEPFGEGATFDQSGSVPTIQPKHTAAAWQRSPKTVWAMAGLAGCLIMATAIGIWWALGQKKQPPATPASNTETSEPIQLSPAASRPHSESRPAPHAAPETEKEQEQLSKGPAQPRPEPSVSVSDSDRAEIHRSRTTEKAASRPMPSQALGTRNVTLRNTRRAMVHVTFKCGRAPIEVKMAAKSRASAQVPQKSCRVTCKGAGEPLCPIYFRETATTLLIR